MFLDFVDGYGEWACNEWIKLTVLTYKLFSGVELNHQDNTVETGN